MMAFGNTTGNGPTSLQTGKTGLSEHPQAVITVANLAYGRATLQGHPADFTAGEHEGGVVIFFVA